MWQGHGIVGLVKVMEKGMRQGYVGRGMGQGMGLWVRVGDKGMKKDKAMGLWDKGMGLWEREWAGTWQVYGSRAEDKYMGKEHGVGTLARTFGNGMGQGHGVGTLARACHVVRTWDKCIGQRHGQSHGKRA